MPHGLTTTMLVLALVCAIVGSGAAIPIGVAALGWEAFIFYSLGSGGG